MARARPMCYLMGSCGPRDLGRLRIRVYSWAPGDFHDGGGRRSHGPWAVDHPSVSSWGPPGQLAAGPSQVTCSRGGVRVSESADVSLRGPCSLPVTERVPGHHLSGHSPTRPGTRSARLRSLSGWGRGGRGGTRQRDPPPIGRAQCWGRGTGRRRVSRLPEAEACAALLDPRLRAAEWVGGRRATGRLGTLAGTAEGAQTTATGTALRTLGSDHFSEGPLTLLRGALALGSRKEGGAGGPADRKFAGSGGHRR